MKRKYRTFWVLALLLSLSSAPAFAIDHTLHAFHVFNEDNTWSSKSFTDGTSVTRYRLAIDSIPAGVVIDEVYLILRFQRSDGTTPSTSDFLDLCQDPSGGDLTQNCPIGSGAFDVGTSKLHLGIQSDNEFKLVVSYDFVDIAIANPASLEKVFSNQPQSWSFLVKGNNPLDQVDIVITYHTPTQAAMPDYYDANNNLWKITPANLSSFLSETSDQNYPPTKPDGSPLSLNDKKVIVIIHGWNPDRKANPYAPAPRKSCDTSPLECDWQNLVKNLVSNPDVKNNNWAVTVYDWHNDAATGPISPIIDAIDNAKASRDAAYVHGLKLGILLSQSQPTEVQFIAHSAGNWVAYRAADYLKAYYSKKKFPNIQIQLTSLDPFVVNGATLQASNFNLKPDFELMAQKGATSNPLIDRRENYYVIDSTLEFDTTSKTDAFFGWTSNVFSQWNINQDIEALSDNLKECDNGAGVQDFFQQYMDNHSGPIAWYAATADTTNQNQIYGSSCHPEPLGFANSLAALEAPSIQPPPQSFPLQANLTVDPSSTGSGNAPLTVALDFQTAGGTGPLTAYVGCGLNGSPLQVTTFTSFTCSYTVPGTYIPWVYVSDAGGEKATGGTLVTVINQLPTLTLTALTSLQEVSPLTVQFKAQASDPDNQAPLSLFWHCDEDGSWREVDSPTSSVDDTESFIYLGVGDHTCQVFALDAQGGIAQQTTTITVQQPTSVNQPPQVSLSVTPNSAEVPANVSVSVTASDPDGTIQRIEVDCQNNGTTDSFQDNIHQPTATFQTVCSYNTPKAFTIKARAFDNLGAEGQALGNFSGSPPPVKQNPTLSFTSGFPTGVNIKEALGGTKITFSVSYQDPANQPPSMIQVWVDVNGDGIFEPIEKINLREVDPTDQTYSDGKLYSTSLAMTFVGNLEPFQPTYHFVAQSADGRIARSANTGLDNDPTLDHTLTIHNNQPTLDFVDPTSQGVSPVQGVAGSDFTFKVRYTDVDAQPPALAAVWIDLNNNGRMDSGEIFDLAPCTSDQYTTDCDGVMINGEVYQTTVKLPYAGDGKLKYQFLFNDGVRFRSGQGLLAKPSAAGQASGSPVLPIYEVTVLPDPAKHNFTLSYEGSPGFVNEPIIPGCTTCEYDLGGVEPDGKLEPTNPNLNVSGAEFTFRIKYFSPDGTLPVQKEVWLDLNGDGKFDGLERFKMELIQTLSDGSLVFERKIRIFTHETKQISGKFVFSDGTYINELPIGKKGDGTPDTLPVIGEPDSLGKGIPDSEEGSAATDPSLARFQFNDKTFTLHQGTNLPGVTHLQEFGKMDPQDPGTIEQAGAPEGGSFLFFAKFKIENIPLNQSKVTMRVDVPEPLPVGSQYYIYNEQTTQWVNVPFTFTNDQRTQIEFTLEDGGETDSDGLKNGVIADPGGVYAPSFGASSGSSGSSGGGGGGGCYTIPIQGPGQGKNGGGRGFFGRDVILFLLLAYGVAGMLKRLKSRRATSDSLKL